MGRLGKFFAALLLLCTLELSIAAPSTAANVSEAVSSTRTKRYSGCYVVLYEHPNYGGRTLTVYGQIGDLTHHAFDNIVNSAKVYGRCHWIFYEHWYYGATSILAPGSYPSSLAWGQQADILTSLRSLPPPGTTAIVLFEHRKFTGNVLVLYDSASFLGPYHFDNVLSSAIVIGGRWRLYERPYYTGQYVTLESAGHYYSSVTGRNYVSSVRLL